MAEDKLLATNGLGKFYRALKTDAEKEDFRRHLRRYMHIYLPDCPFEVASTNRYTIFQEEASISARRFIKSHETIKYLSGIQVVITPEEEAQLSERKKDFSIVVSSRKKEANLFMGPARFANHDCDANARLVTTGQAGIEIIATKHIGVGEEITVTYGDSYFGEDNCECLCKTCEDNLVNGWAPADGSAPVKQSIEEGSLTPVQGYSLRRREEHSFNRGNSETPSLTPIARPKVSKASLRKVVRTADATPATDDGIVGSPLADALSRQRGQKRQRDSLLATPPITPAKRPKVLPEALLQISGSSSRQSSANIDDTVSSAAVESPTPRRSLFAESIEVVSGGVEDCEVGHDQMPTPEASQQSAESDAGESEIRDSIVVSSLNSTMEETKTTILKVEEPVSMEGLTLPTPEASMDSEEDEKVDETLATIVAIQEAETMADVANAADTIPVVQPPRRGRPRKNFGNGEPHGPAAQKPPKKASRRSGEHAGEEDGEEDDESDAPKRQRVPGDYTLTPLLLSEPETAWVICSVCSKAFVQHDAYFTRMSCPRCERHSKLYGYMWPKTEPESKGDKEERILDHRLVHRFLHAGDEAKIRGRKPAPWYTNNTADGDDQPRTGRETTDGNSSLGSGIWRKLQYMIKKEKAEQASKLAKSKGSKAPKAAEPATKAETAKAAKEAASRASEKAAKTTSAKRVAKVVKTAKTTKANKVTKVVKRGRTTKTAAAAKSTKPSGAARTAKAASAARVVKTAKAFRGPWRSGRPRLPSVRAEA